METAEKFELINKHFNNLVTAFTNAKATPEQLKAIDTELTRICAALDPKVITNLSNLLPE